MAFAAIGPGLGAEGSRRVALLDKASRVSRTVGRNLDRMGRGGWVFLIEPFLCREHSAGAWNGWVAAGECS